MANYIAMERGDLAEMAAGAARGERPRHAMSELAELTAARVIHPGGEQASVLDRLRARLIGTPELWAWARALRRTLTVDDVIYCGNETLGFPIAATCGGQGTGPRVIVLVHNVARPRAVAAIRLFGLKHRVDSFLAVSSLQIDALRRVGVDPRRLLTIGDQTDIRFFTPGTPPAVARPVIMSVGLEQRDYRTLAAATADMPVDVRISGFSRDAVAVGRAFPATLPANMARDYYAWPDLLALYRSAAVVVVSLFPNRYAAGIQVMLEAIACGRPLVVTRTEGLAEYLDRPDLITTVPPGDPARLREAIAQKLDAPDQAQAQATAARDHYLPIIDSARYSRAIADRMAAASRSSG